MPAIIRLLLRASFRRKPAVKSAGPAFDTNRSSPAYLDNPAIQDPPMRACDQPHLTCRPIQRSRLRLAAGLALLAASGAPAFSQATPTPLPAAAASTPAGSSGAENSGAGSLAQLAAQFEKSADTVVADVNGTPITLGMVADRLHEFPEKFAVLPTTLVYKAALDDLIQQRALAVKARQLGLDKTAATQRQIVEATDRVLGQALVRRIVPEMVTEKAIESGYNATIAGKPGPEQVQFRVIATATDADAMIVLDRLSRGVDFGALARIASKDPSALNGGEVGYASRDRLTPEIGAVAFALMPGQITAFPVHSNGLSFILQVEGRRQQTTPTLAEAKATVTPELIKAASIEVLRKAREAVVVKDFGPTGMAGRDPTRASPTH
jgi:peptidyl-prolyl cis-trans isomerase C